jgi:hypothetical protein
VAVVDHGEAAWPIVEADRLEVDGNATADVDRPLAQRPNAGSSSAQDAGPFSPP